MLVSWLGHTDIRATDTLEHTDASPLALALEGLLADEVLILSDLSDECIQRYREWLGRRTSAKVRMHPVAIESPDDYGQVYSAAEGALRAVLDEIAEPVDLVFNLTSGTPATTAAWVVLARTSYPADLVESSRITGLRLTTVPVDGSAVVALGPVCSGRDLLLAQLSEGSPPLHPEFGDIICRSEAMKRVITAAAKVAVRSVPVLIEGESGTGKELLARAIHMSSPRKVRRFVAVNCGAIPSELIESELFGHEKGAFTGAHAPREGYFCTADGGTLFLDEVSELPPPAQVKLLRVLQDGVVYRLGSDRPVHTDVRVIAATNRMLTTQIASGKFRSDLFYRLAVAVLRLPALRDRPGDIDLLIGHILEQVNRESAIEPGYRPKRLSDEARQLLLEYSWPGNVRELMNTLRRAVIWSDDDLIGPAQVTDAIINAEQGGTGLVLNRPLGNGLDIRKLVAEVVRHYLERALRESGGNKTRAAELVGLPSYQTLTNWMKKHGLAENGD